MPHLIPRQITDNLPTVPSDLPVDPSDILSSLLPEESSSAPSDTTLSQSNPPDPGDVSSSIQPPPLPSESFTPIPSETSSVFSPPPPSSESLPTPFVPRSSEDVNFSTDGLLSSSSSPSLESTTSFTTVTTSISGTLVTFTSAITALADPSKTNRDEINGRTALIAGLTIGFIFLLLAILGGVFAWRRRSRRRQQELLTAQKMLKEHKNLLDGEGFEDDDEAFLRSHNSYPAPMSNGTLGRAVSPTPSPIRSRASETGSIFRENVWPPPQDSFIDPIHKESSQVDLSGIVDQVMGRPAELGHDRRPTDSSADSSTPIFQHNRRNSSDSWTPSIYSDPFASSSQTHIHEHHPISHSGPPSAGMPDTPSIALSPLPLGAAAPYQSSTLHRATPPNSPPENRSFTSTSSSSYLPNSAPRSTSPTSSTGGNRLSRQPKKSSPLARALTQDAKLWLTRSPHPPASHRAG